MSDSEDEAAFASADEGEVTDKSSPKKKSGSNESAAVAAAAAAQTTTAESGKKDSASGQSKNQKKKGKKGKKNEPQKSEAAKPQKREVKEDVKPKETKKTDKEIVDTTGEKDVQKESEKKSVDKSSTKADTKKDTLKDEKNGVKTDISKDEKPKPEEPKEIVKTDSKPKEDLKATPEKSSASPQVESPGTQSIPRSAGQGEVTGVEETTEPQEKSSGGWGWGSWGSSLLTAASSSVSTFTSQVGEGFTTIVDSVESSLGAPPPEEIARLEAERKEEGEEKETDRKEEKTDEGNPSEAEKSKSREDEKPSGGAEEGGGGGWFSTLGVSSLTSKIQNTGKSLVSGSLDAVEALATGSIDVLENIGKKTINVLSDHDPGFKKTRSTLFEHGEKKQNLSTLLREAKEQAERDASLREEQEEARKHNYGAVFDDFQGLAHLEALEILSNQSEKKVQALLTSLPPDSISQLKPQLLEIKELFELDDSDYEDRKEHDFSKLITDLLSELHLGTTPDKLNKVQEKNRQWIINFYTEPAEGEEKPKVEPKEIFHAAISALAELTAKSVEQFHKAGELILLQKDSDTSFEKRSKSLSCLTQVLCTEVSILSTKFTQCLHKAGEEIEDSSVITPLVTNVYLEASNSSTYIQDGFQLLLPVLQQAAIQNSPLLES